MPGLGSSDHSENRSSKDQDFQQSKSLVKDQIIEEPKAIEKSQNDKIEGKEKPQVIKIEDEHEEPINDYQQLKHDDKELQIDRQFCFTLKRSGDHLRINVRFI